MDYEETLAALQAFVGEEIEVVLAFESPDLPRPHVSRQHGVLRRAEAAELPDGYNERMVFFIGDSENAFSIGVDLFASADGNPGMGWDLRIDQESGLSFYIGRH